MRAQLVVGAAFSLLMVSPAIAADIEVAPEPVDIYDWSGFYIGANGGYAWGDGDDVNLFTDDITPVNLGDSTTESRGTIGSLSADGWFGGLQAGWNLQSGLLVFGIEADIQASDIDDELSGTFTNPSGTQGTSGTASLEMDWFGTLRGRLGAAFDRVLLYITGGVAFGDIDYEMFVIETGGLPLFEASLESSGTETGYVVGAGAEHAFAENWTIKFEYQYIDFGNISATAPVTNIVGGAATGETARTDIDAAFHTARVGINFKF